MKRINLPRFFLLPAMIMFTGIWFPISAQNNDQRAEIQIDTGWRFHLGHAGDPEKDFNFSISNIFAKSGRAENCAINPRFDDRTWRRIDLPHDWAVELPFTRSENADVMAHGFKPMGGLFPETSVGWYRKHFSVSRADSGQRFFIRFDGIYRDAKIWLNGFYLGTNESGYVGITYDVSDYIDFDGSNILVVRVDATQYEGWFYEGAGIYRHVWLIKTSEVYIPENGIYIRSELDGNDARVTIRVEVQNDRLEPVTVNGIAVVEDRSGREVARTTLPLLFIQPRSENLWIKQITLKNPRLWDITDPYLYHVHINLLENEVRIDDVRLKTGIRSVRFDPETGFWLNGKNIKILGVNCHQDHAGVGAAIPDALQYYRIRLLQEMGVNAYRTSHHAPAPELLDACDSLGMLVLDEQRLLNSSPEYLGQFERLIRRDRNHPSVFLWSIGNEEGMIQTNGIGKRIALSLMALQHQLDPSRTCTYAADLPNYFTGINEVIPIRSFNYRHQAVEDYHRSHPHQPILGTEMGSTVTTRGVLEKDTVKCYLPDQDISAPWWASTAEEWWKQCARQPWWMGGFIWTGFDYRGEPTPFGWPNINSHFGIMDMCGFPKNIYFYYQSWWTNKDVLHISPHWNWEGRVKKGDSIKVWVNSNADEVELFLNGKSFGIKRMQANSHLSWNVPYIPGKLEAIGSKNGRKLQAITETTGKPSAILLSADRKQVKADGQEVVVINVSITDEHNRTCPDADNLVRFRVTGPARMIGVGNGDPSCHEPDVCKDGLWQRSLFNGRCQLIVQSQYDEGEITITGESAGIQPGKIKITSIKTQQVK